ncbi:MAG: tetratricopeptide repeat protein [Bdellovibrionaceae bacterium]|nr:tetratricopeptide repeat protein [Bdellovibrio sp.]
MPDRTIPPVTTPTPTNTGDTLESPKAAPGKYEEYQSICRTNEYDHIFYFSEDLKNKRIKLLRDKISSGKDVSKIKIRLLKEYVDQRKTPAFNELYSEVKNMKLTPYENSLVDAYDAYQQKKLKVARDILVKLIAPNIKNIESAKFLAEIYKEQGNFFEAAQIYYDLNKQQSGGFYDFLCEALILDSHHADGEKACQKAIKETPHNPYSVVFLGISYREKDMRVEAIEQFTNSLKVKETEMGLTCLAELYFIDNKFAAAVKYFEKSLALTPQSARALIGLGWAQLKDKNTKDALLTFKKVCHADRKNEVEIRKAYKYLMAQNSPEAKKFIDLIQTCNE